MNISTRQQLELSLLNDDVETARGCLPFRHAMAAAAAYCHAEGIRSTDFDLRLVCELSAAHTAACIVEAAPNGLTRGWFPAEVLELAGVPYVGEADPDG